jgi:hypothetical protein
VRPRAQRRTFTAAYKQKILAEAAAPRALGANAGPNGTMLVFFRSADW